MKNNVSILLPVYNGATTIADTIRTVLAQSFHNFELIIQDNNSTDETDKVITSFSDSRIKYYKNKTNLGYPGNLNTGIKNCNGDIVYLLGADDLMSIRALENTVGAFSIDPEIGAVTRPYFWFDRDITKPVRVTRRMNPHKDEIVTIKDPLNRILRVLDNEVLGQLSGLAMRRKFIDIPFHSDPWISHGYPWASIFKKHPVVFLKDYQLAVRIGMNEVRKKSSPIFNRSPVERWVEFFETVFHEPEHEKTRKACINRIVASNYVGLVQIRNFGSLQQCIKEAVLLLKLRPENIFNPKFWFYATITTVLPPIILLPIADWYKRVRYRKFGKMLNFQHG